MCAHGGTGKREPAARATDFAAEKKKELEESIRAEKENRATKSRCLEDRQEKKKQREKKHKETEKASGRRKRCAGNVKNGKVKASQIGRAHV